MVLSILIPLFAVVPGNLLECNNNRRLTLQDNEGIIASITAQNGGLGTYRCPWVIKAEAGQRINITLIDFGLNVRYTGKEIMILFNLF